MKKQTELNIGDKLIKALEEEILLLREVISTKNEIIELQKKQLLLNGVSKSFAVGKKVRIEKNTMGHDFEIGSIVNIIEYDMTSTAPWLCSDGKDTWWICEEEANVC